MHTVAIKSIVGSYQELIVIQNFKRNDTRLGGIANSSEDRLKIQKSLEKLEQWALSNKVQGSDEKSIFAFSIYLGKTIRIGIK